MAPSDKSDSSQEPLAKFKPNKGFIKLNNNNNVQVVATTSVSPLNKYFKREKKFTPLNESLYIIMSQLLQKKILKVPSIKAIDPSKITSPYYDAKSFFQYHHQPSHDTEKFSSLRSKIQDLIDNNTIFMVGMNDKGKKFIAPPNQNLQIFNNPLPSHPIPLM